MMLMTHLCISEERVQNLPEKNQRAKNEVCKSDPQNVT